MLLSAIALAIVARDFGFNVHTRDEMDMNAETQHAAQSALTFLTQELRQAGACMPDLGDFIALDGVNNGTKDELTLRIGIADPDTLQCNRTLLTAQANTNATQVKVQSTAGFEVGQWVYIIKSSGHGRFFKVSSISHPWLRIEGKLDVNYGANSGVYAVEERTYEIQTVGGVSVLMVSIDGEDPQPMVHGIESFNVTYKMAPCPPCTSVNIPPDDDEWRVVREVDLTVTAKSSRKGKDGKYETVQQTATVKPRNLL